MKKLISLMLALSLLSSLLAVTSFAEGEKRLYDDADVLSDAEEAALEDSLNAFSENWGIDTRVVLESQQMGTYLDYDAENAFIEKAVSKDGVLLMINCQEADAFTHAEGSALSILGSFGASDVSGVVEEVLDTGSYSSAVYAFISSLGAEFSDDLTGEQYIPEKRILPRLTDNAGLLSIHDAEKLTSLLDDISESHDFEVVIATVDFLDNRSPKQYAADWYDYNGYGMAEDDSGIIFMISMGDRDWAISTRGFGIEAFTDAGQDMLIERLIGDLSDGYYMDAFTTFAESCDEFLTRAESGDPYDVGNMPKKPMSFFYYVICAIIALIVGFTGAGSLKSQLKSVQKQVRADSYSRKNSLAIPERNEIFLYSNVSKMARPKETRSSSGRSGGSSTYSSSSGRSHGGSSGKF